MAFEKGHEKKGGRKAGTKNKVTGATREALAKSLEGQIGKVDEMLDELKNDPANWILALSRLLPYILPKMQSVTFKDENADKAALIDHIEKLNENVTKTMKNFKEKLMNNVIDDDE